LVLPGLPRALSSDCGSGSTSPKSDCLATVDCSSQLQDHTGAGKHSTASKHVQIQCKSDTVRPDVGADTAADTTALSDQRVKPAGGSTGPLQQPQLVGFVLLDPLWEENEEIGYVASLMRMKKTAQSGGRDRGGRGERRATAAGQLEGVGQDSVAGSRHDYLPLAPAYNGAECILQ